MTKTVCMLFLIRFGMVCYLPALCAEEKVQVPGTVEDATGATEVTEEKVTEEITVSAHADDPLAAQQNASAVQLDGDLLRSLPAKLEDPLAVASLFVNPAANDAGGTRIVVDGVEGDTLDLPSSSVKTYRDNNFDATNDFDTVNPSRQRDWVEGELDGPWLGGKATFFVGGDYLRDNNNSFITALTPSGAVSEPLPFPRRTAHLIARSTNRGRSSYP